MSLTDLLGVESWLLIGSLLLLLRYYIHRKWQYLEKLGIPHDTPSLLKVGHALHILSDGMFTYDLKSKQKHGPVWGYYVGLNPRLMIHDVGILQQILIKEFATFPNRQTFLTQLQGEVFASGLLLIQDEQWKRVRSTMTPTFSSSKLRQMSGIIDWCTDNTVQAFRKRNETADGTFNATRVFSCLSMNVICSAAFSTQVNSQDDAQKEPEITVQAKKLLNVGIFNSLFILCGLFPFLEPLAAKYNSSRSEIKYFKKLTIHLIEQRKKNMDATNRVDLMQLMLESEVPKEKVQNGATKGMTRLEIIGNSVLMILAGYETTGNTMTFLAYNLAQHPQVQSELQTEIDEMFKTCEKIDYDAVNKLKLLDMCVLESLRLYSPVSRTIRRAEKEITINGLTIPAGITVAVPIYALGHDPEFWDDPMEFKPYRMQDMSHINPMVYNPFGAGPRNCIGMRFAILEVKMAFCKFLHNFTFEPTDSTPKPPLKLKFDITTRPKTEFQLRAVPRK